MKIATNFILYKLKVWFLIDIVDPIFNTRFNNKRAITLV